MKMKVLKICAMGLPLFKDDIELSFTASQRVSENDKQSLYNLFDNIYQNPTDVIAGINASGKTSILKLILLALGILNNEPINHLEVKDILGKSSDATIVVYFYQPGNICKLETHIAYKEGAYAIVNESLYSKSTDLVRTRKGMLEFSEDMLAVKRNGEEEFLPDDVSIIIAQNKKNNAHMMIENMLIYTNTNILPTSDEIPRDIIAFLDPTVESIIFEHKNDKELIHLRFFGQDEILLNNARELEKYLSSGTIKGIIVFSKAMEVLRHGGYMVVDEIENHFNREIVATLIRFFMDLRINKNGAVLIFSTHYPELLDEYDRNDSIYITRNRGGIELKKLTEILTRNDVKRSDAYQSGLLEGTTPTYDAYIKLKKSVASYV